MLLEDRRVTGESGESDEESDNNILLDSSDSSDSSDSVSISSTDEDQSVTEFQPEKPVSESAVVFSAKIEKAEQYWHEDDSDDQEENLRTSLNLRENFLSEIAK